jgi:signal transduction histidine kinase
LGAPLGLLVLRRLSGGSREGLRHELESSRLTYAYLTGATCAVFGAFGWILGRRADDIVAGHREIDRLREEFASVIAHDLRSPVNALRLQSQLLLAKATADEVPMSRRAIERIHHATGDLAQMIDDLLDASRLESQRLVLHPEPRALDELAGEVIERQRPALGSHPVELHARTPARALVDPHRFAQILTNLLDNAAKYSDENRPILVSIEPTVFGVSVRVQDQGWGIAADDLPRLFDRFYQAKRARAKKSGLGLGLYIVKGLVEAQGGRISVASIPGRGSTFTVWFPAPA